MNCNCTHTMMGYHSLGGTETLAEWFDSWKNAPGFWWLDDLAVHIATNPGVIDQLPADQQAIIQQAGGKEKVVQAAKEYESKSNFKKALIWIIPSLIVAGGLVYVLTRPKKAKP